MTPNDIAGRLPHGISIDPADDALIARWQADPSKITAAEMAQMEAAYRAWAKGVGMLMRHRPADAIDNIVPLGQLHGNPIVRAATRGSIPLSRFRVQRNGPVETPRSWKQSSVYDPAHLRLLRRTPARIIPGVEQRGGFSPAFVAWAAGHGLKSFASTMAPVAVWTGPDFGGARSRTQRVLIFSPNDAFAYRLRWGR